MSASLEDFSGEEVSFAKLTGNIFVPGVGDVDKTLEKKSNGKIIRMTYFESVLKLELKHQKELGKQVVVFVPITSFTHWVF